MKDDFSALTKKAKQLVKEGRWEASPHALYDHLDREITTADVLEVLKVGGVVRESPPTRENPYKGALRHIWVGQDINDRVLRLVVTIVWDVVIVSAALANQGETETYLAEDQEDL